jgi:hypothetical protein
MPKPHIARNLAFAALALGLIFLAANVYFNGHGHPTLASVFFGIAALFEVAFAMLCVLWLYCRSWHKEPERPPGPMPGMKPGAMPPGMPTVQRQSPPQQKP